jgi:hypothetical protein
MRGSGGGQEFMGAVDCRRSDRPDTDVRTSRFEALSCLLGPGALGGSFVGFKGIEGGFEQLWEYGTGSAAWSGVCGCLSAPYKVFPSSPKPLISPVTARQ